MVTLQTLARRDDIASLTAGCDPWRSAILLVAGDKAGNWTKWYARMIPRAEQLYEIYLKERAAEEGSQ